MKQKRTHAFTFSFFVEGLMKDTELTSTQKMVLIAIAERMRNGDGKCWMSSKQIAEAAGVTSRTAKTTVAQLQQLGYLTIEVRKSDETGATLANGYFIKSMVMDGSETTAHPSETISRGVGNQFTGGDEMISPLNKNKQNNNKNTKTLSPEKTSGTAKERISDFSENEEQANGKGRDHEQNAAQHRNFSENYPAERSETTSLEERNRRRAAEALRLLSGVELPVSGSGSSGTWKELAR